MKAKFWLTSLVALTVLSLSCSKKSTNPGGGSGFVSTTNISILDNSFSPRNDSVAVGTTITWTYSVSASNPHTVTSDQVGLFGSGTLSTSGATFTHTFNAAGDFGYHCTIHPSMTGTIKVR